MTGLALLLLVVAGALLVLGMITIALAPVLASRVASTTSKPTLERRASGPDRMRNLIQSQRTERSRSRGLAATLTRTGIGLAALAALSLVGGLVAWFAGY